MNRKLKSTLGLVGLLILILLAGGIYVFVVQRGDIKDKKAQLKKLDANHYDQAALAKQLMELTDKAAVLDSILASRKFNVPQNLSSIKFFTFVNKVSNGFTPVTKTDVQFLGTKKDKEFSLYEYKLAGGGTYNDLYRLVYSIEQSKELKKITAMSLSNLISTDKDGYPQFLINYDMTVDVYYSDNDRFSTKEYVENNLNTNRIYDSFYPLIRNEIPPNADDLLDVQGAKLLALIPEGAFISDSKGKTYLLW